ncbi:MAG: MBL fold metallo-hydrolase [Bacteroidales bacterium]|nr:MBL fold metallo-hydrolase [Bacteroidales bacterium]
MKRYHSTEILLLFLILLSTVFLKAQERESPPVSLEKITERIYQINGGQGSNGGVIIGDREVLVIDSKMNKESVDQTLAAIQGLTDKPVKYLVNTHSDGDHIMGNRYFPASVTFIAHINCRDDFFKENFGRAPDWGEPEFYPFTPSLTFQENLNIWMGEDKVELHYFGVGHTTGDIVVYHPEDKVAFLGDQFFSGRPQLIHSNKNGNSFQHVLTLTKMLETLDAEVFLSGHSDPVGRGEIQQHIRQMADRQDKVRELISQDKSLEETLKEFDENETRLVTSIYQEITGKGPGQSNENPY